MGIFSDLWEQLLCSCNLDARHFMASELEILIYRIVSILLGAISLVSSTYVACHISRNSTKVISNRVAYSSKLYMEKCLFVLFIALAIDAFGYTFSSLDSISSFFCNLHSIIQQWSEIFIVYWITYMSVYSLVILQRRVWRIERYFRHVLIFLLLASAFPAFWYVAYEMYEMGVLWCWLGEDHIAEQFLGYYYIVMFFWIVNIFIFFALLFTLYSRTKTLQQTKYLRMRVHLGRQAAKYLIAFIAAFLFPLLDRLLYALSETHTNFWIQLLHNISNTGLGFFYVLVFKRRLIGHMSKSAIRSIRTCQCCFENMICCATSAVTMSNQKSETNERKDHPDDENQEENDDKKDRVNSNLSDRSLMAKDSKGYDDYYKVNKELNIKVFCSTFNMAECGIEVLQYLRLWIPRTGYDIYIIGLQECMIVKEIKDGILEYLSGNASLNHSDTEESEQCSDIELTNINKGNSSFFHSNSDNSSQSFVAFSAEIGSTQTRLGYHGMIAIMIFIPQEVVKSGNFAILKATKTSANTGKNLVVARAANKGGVGLAFRYHDTTFAVLSCHLASDNHGKNRCNSRKQQAQSILSDLILSGSGLGEVDLHLHYHHTIVLGDMNFRLRGALSDILRIIEEACITEDLRVQDKIEHASANFKLLMKQQGYNCTASHEKKKYINWRQLKYMDILQNIGDASPSTTPRKGEDNQLRFFKPTYNYNFDVLFEKDELQNLMREHEIFHNFTEMKINFPPTFKYKTEENKLTEHSKFLTKNEEIRDEDTISIHLESNLGNENEQACLNTYDDEFNRHENELGEINVMEGLSYLRKGPYCNQNSLSKLYQTYKKEKRKNLQDADTDAYTGDSLVGLRVPSYTDRILVHSLEERRSAVYFHAYEACDDMKVSDHKPVSLIVHFTIDQSIDDRDIKHFDCFDEYKSNADLDMDSTENYPSNSSILDFLSITPNGKNDVDDTSQRIPPAAELLRVNNNSSIVSFADDDYNIIETYKLRLYNIHVQLYERKHIAKVNNVWSGISEYNSTFTSSSRMKNILNSTSNSISGDTDSISNEINVLQEKDGVDNETETLASHIRRKSISTDSSYFSLANISNIFFPVYNPFELFEVQMIFPLPAEDPYFNRRVLSLIFDDLIDEKKPKTNDTSKKGRGSSINRVKNNVTERWAKSKIKGVSLTSFVTPKFGVHALIHLYNKSGVGIGQAVIPLQVTLEEGVDEVATDLVEGGALVGKIFLTSQLLCKN